MSFYEYRHCIDTELQAKEKEVEKEEVLFPFGEVAKFAARSLAAGADLVPSLLRSIFNWKLAKLHSTAYKSGQVLDIKTS